MNQKKAKLLRRAARKSGLIKDKKMLYKKLKQSYKSMNVFARAGFIKQIKGVL